MLSESEIVEISSIIKNRGYSPPLRVYYKPYVNAIDRSVYDPNHYYKGRVYVVDSSITLTVVEFSVLKTPWRYKGDTQMVIGPRVSKLPRFKSYEDFETLVLKDSDDYFDTVTTLRLSQILG